MSSIPSQSLPEGFQSWSAQEKLDYVAHVWESILEDEVQLPVLAWQRQAIDEARRTRARSGAVGEPWRDSHARLRERVSKGSPSADEG